MMEERTMEFSEPIAIKLDIGAVKKLARKTSALASWLKEGASFWKLLVERYEWGEGWWQRWYHRRHYYHLLTGEGQFFDLPWEERPLDIEGGSLYQKYVLLAVKPPATILHIYEGVCPACHLAKETTFLQAVVEDTTAALEWKEVLTRSVCDVCWCHTRH